jgi:hypothetical protein
VFYVTHTFHIGIINTSAKIAHNKAQFMTGINLLRIFAPDSHLQIKGMQA